MSCRTRQYARGGRLPRHLPATAAATALIALSCNFLGDLMKPFEYSTVTFHGTVRDSAFGYPVENAGVILEDSGETATTDGDGCFTFAHARTGPRKIIVARSDYRADTFPVDLTLDVRPDTFLLVRKNARPEITGFSAHPAKLFSCEDTVRFYFEARDSTGGIVKAVVEPGDGQSRELAWAGAPVNVRDSLCFRYLVPCTLDARLIVVGKNADTAVRVTRVAVPANKRPVFTLVRLSQDGFVNGELGFIEVYAGDPDGNFNYLTIHWGDTSKTEKSPDSGAPHWHKYAFAKDTSLAITIRLYDSAGATRDTSIRADVRTPSAPTLGDSIVFDPHQFLTPEDTAVIIGVRVIGIEGGYVKTILWSINQGEPEGDTVVRKSYTPVTGQIGDFGSVFASSFSTGKLIKGTNIVQIMVFDRNDRSSAVMGSFYKLGARSRKGVAMFPGSRPVR